MDHNEVIISSTEIIKDRLYFATLRDGFKPKPTKNSKYFHIEDEIVYENFYFDYGPYHLCHLYQFCNRLNNELANHPKKKVVFYTSNNDALRLNAAYLIGSYQIIYLGKDPEWVHRQLTEGSEWRLLGFRDASGGPSLFDINLLDVLRGLKRAHDAKFFDFEHFNEEEYLFYEKVDNGDLNWIVPGKMLAFSGPHQRSRIDRGYPLHSPEHYHQYFKSHNVSTVVRLNKKSYDARQFTAHGFEHRELFFVDGSVPSDVIVNRFLRIAEAAKGAVAVHCKAGLGRTGTLIGCYMMKHHGFGAREAIAWLRICRPGSVIGYQQMFLENIESRMHSEGEAHRRRHNMPSLPVCARPIYCDAPADTLDGVTPPDVVDNAGDKPVSLTTILGDNKNLRLDNANDLNGNEACDRENNIAPLICKFRTTPTPNKSVFTSTLNYMLPTNNVKNANNTNLNLKAPPRILNANIKSQFSSKTSTFPPRNLANQGKVTGARQLYTAKNSFHGQRANLARPNLTFNSSASPLKVYVRKSATVTQKANPETNVVPNVTTTLTAMTENCHLSKSNETALKSPVKMNSNNNRKKPIVRANSNSRKKQPKSTLKSNLNSSIQDLSSSDTNITNISADSLEAPRINRKRDKSSSPEPMDCLTNSIITSDVTPANFEESQNSQGNKLYKIKALRKKCPALGAGLIGKKDGVQTRSGSSGLGAKKK